MTEWGKLTWQCRRGTRELDLLLNHYLQTRYLIADDQEKSRFVNMLTLDDSELLNQQALLHALKEGLEI